MWVGTALQGSCLIILDVEVQVEFRSALSFLSSKDGGGVILVGTKELAAGLDRILSEVVLPELPPATLVVFPGNGGQKVRYAAAFANRFLVTDVFAKRIWEPGKEPFAIAGEILPGRILLPEVEVILVLDDVISSGKTMTRIWERNAWKFPRARWICGSWIRQQRSSVRGYQAVVSAVIASRGDGRRIPINSLSALIDDAAMAEAYAHRNFLDPTTLLELLEVIRCAPTLPV